MAMQYQLVRSSRRTLALVVERTGALTVRAPRRMPLREIEAFIAEKESWILKKQAMVNGHADRAKPLGNGDLLPLANGPLTLCLGDVPFAFSFHGSLLLPAALPLPKSLIPWLKSRAEEALGPRVNALEEATGLRAERLCFSTAQTRWGSMNSKGVLRLNIALLFCPGEIVDYVIVHELAHLRHLDHSAAFWRLVGSLMPDFRRRRDWLKENRHLIRLLSF